MDVKFDKLTFLLKTYVVSIAIVALYLLLYLWFSVATYKLIMLVGFATLLITGYAFTKSTLRLSEATHYYIICCYLFLCFGTATSSGVENPGTIWFLFCPLISFITLNSFMTRIWLAIILITLSAFYFFEPYLVVDKFRGGKHWYLVASLLQFAMVYYVVKIFRKEVSKKAGELHDLNKIMGDQQHELLQQAKSLRDAEFDAIDRNNRLSSYLDLLESKQRQIEELNESLEKKVVIRTMELKYRNEQLTEFAFINAHSIRGPVCRLQGLRNLLLVAETTNDVFILRDYVSTCIEELDIITRKASKLLEDVAPLDGISNS